MLAFHLFRHYFLSFKSASLIRLVAWFCLGGLTVSVAALVLVLSIMDGFGQSIKSRFLTRQPHLILRSKSSQQVQVDFKTKDPVRSVLPNHLQEQVKSSVLFETQDVLLKTNQGFFGVIARGYSSEVMEELLSLARKERFESLNQIQDLSSDADASDSLSSGGTKGNLPSKTAGKRLTYAPASQNEGKGSVTASLPLIITESVSTAFHLYEDDAVLLTPIMALLLPPTELPPLKKAHIQAVVRELQGDGEEEGFSIFYQRGLMDFKGFSSVRPVWRIKLLEPENYKAYLPYFKDYRVEHWAERNASLLFALKMEKFIMVLFISLAILISCLGIAVALFLLIVQKRNDIGILQAMGLSPKEVTKTFVKVGFGLSFIGIMSGLLLGLTLTAFFKYSDWNVLPAMYYDRSLPASFLPLQYAFILFGSLIIAFPACYLPALHLSRRPVVNLLKARGR